MPLGPEIEAEGLNALCDFLRHNRHVRKAYKKGEKGKWQELVPTALTYRFID